MDTAGAEEAASGASGTRPGRAMGRRERRGRGRGRRRGGGEGGRKERREREEKRKERKKKKKRRRERKRKKKEKNEKEKEEKEKKTRILVGSGRSVEEKGVERIHDDEEGAGLKREEKSDRIMERVRKNERDEIAGIEAEALQIRG
ncbi:hypothetical protein OIV53_31325, partial [Burkholderia pseudomallei]|uniref:hypothetical protein n=1 Tax=Burkholderia pseudomallei TaxID=28450 RepID=UPI0021F7C249